MMKYYSDKTHEFYDTAEACQSAEFKAKEEENRERIRKEREAAAKKEEQEKFAAERKVRANEVDNARKAMVAAQNKYREVLTNFIKTYGTYHYSTKNFDDLPTLFEFFSQVL